MSNIDLDAFMDFLKKKEEFERKKETERKAAKEDDALKMVAEQISDMVEKYMDIYQDLEYDVDDAWDLSLMTVQTTFLMIGGMLK